MDGGSGADQASMATLTSAFAAQANVGTEWTYSAEKLDKQEWKPRREDLELVSVKSMGARGLTRHGRAVQHGDMYVQEGYSGGEPQVAVSEQLLRRLEPGGNRPRKSRLLRSTSEVHLGGGKGGHRVVFAPHENRTGTTTQGARGKTVDARMYLNHIYKPNKHVEVPKLQLDNLGGGPSSQSLSQYSANTTTSNKTKHRQKLGGMARAYSEQFMQLPLKGADALYWNDINEGNTDSREELKPSLEGKKLQIQSSKSLSRNRHGKQHNPGLTRAQSVDPEMTEITRPTVSLPKTTPDVRSHGVAAPIAERATSLPWHAGDIWAGNREHDQHGAGPSDMRLWSGTPVDAPAISRDAFPTSAESKRQRPRTPLEIPRLPRVYSNPRDNLASLAPLEAWSIGDKSSEAYSLHRPPDSVYLDRQWSQNLAHLHQSTSLKDLNSLRETECDGNINFESKSRTQPHVPLRMAQSLQSAVTFGMLQKEPWELYHEESKALESEDLGEIRQASNVDLSAHLNQQQNLNRTDSFPNFFGRNRSSQYPEDMENMDEADLKGVDVTIPIANLEDDGGLTQLNATSAVSLRRLGNDEASFTAHSPSNRIVSPFAQLAAADQDVRPMPSHPSPLLPEPPQDLGRSRKHLPPTPNQDSRLPGDRSNKDLPSLPNPPQAKPKGVPWWMLLMHYLSLLVAELPLRSHRRWLRRMYRENRLAKPADDDDPQGNDSEFLDSIGSLISPHPKRGHRWQYSSDEEFMKARYSRTRVSQGAQNLRRVGKQRKAIRNNQDPLVEAELGRLPKRSPRPLPLSPQINLPRTHHKSAEMSSPHQPSWSRHSVMRSLDRFGGLLTSLTPRNHRSSFSRMGKFSGNRTPEQMSTAAWNKQTRIRLRRRKGRLARIWDHIRHPLTSMRRKYKKSPYKARLIAAIGRRTSHTYAGPWDRIQTELLIWGQWAFELLSPPKYNRSFLLFTTLFPFLLLTVFFFMAGEYPSFLEETAELHDGFGPHEMKDWMLDSSKWRTFNSAFLAQWGARFLPYVPNQPQRWFSAIFIHENFGHLASNGLLFIILSWGLETKYGSWRTLLVCLLSGIAGNFVSAIGEDPCALVLGASGCVFGLAAFYVIDIVVDFKNVVFPFLRLFGVLVFLSATAIALATQRGASHLSHLGGFLSGWGISFIFTPRFIDERIEAAVPWVLLLTILISFVTIPVAVYESVIPGLVCMEI